MRQKQSLNAMSLFANVGIAEAYLDKANVNVLIANEIEQDRVNFYHHFYPAVDTLVGDITSTTIQDSLVKKALEQNVQLIIATPPCQGMSTAGKKEDNDPRNTLICSAVDIIKRVFPLYVFLENVPEQLTTKLLIHGKEILIPDYINDELGDIYFIKKQVLNAADYGVPQTRERAIFLLTKKTQHDIWDFPSKIKKQKTMEDAIGDLPLLDPEIKDIEYEEMLKIFPEFEKRKAEALKISKWHYPPAHVYRQVNAMMHTPSGKSAFDNIDDFKPKKLDGTIVKGYKNTYKRQDWDKPAFTVTMFNRTIGSQNNVHPGRYIGEDSNGFKLYSDARVLTIFELMRVMSLPDDWDIPSGYSDNFIRSVIGEGIPPLMVLRIMENLPNEA